MPDRVDRRAAELAAEASQLAESRRASEARVRAALIDLQETLVTNLAGHTRYRIKTNIDSKEGLLQIAYAKRQFDTTIERYILEIRLNRSEFERGSVRVFQLRVPFDAGLPTWMTPPADDIAVGDALKRSTEIVLESMAKSVANGCTIVDPG